MAKKRLDLELVARGLVKSRTLAQRLITEGAVRVNTITILDNSYDVSGADKIEVHADAQSLKYVSRGGLKLEAALDKIRLDVTGSHCLDVGISTGGFTDCLLKRGATQIVGVDVGHYQLAEALQKDERVKSFEGINAKDISKEFFEERTLTAAFDLIVVDVSFISLAKVLPQLVSLLNETGRVLALVKPQFELEQSSLDKHGVVRDQENYPKVEQKMRELCRKINLNVTDYFPSVIEGSDGNKEYFIFLQH